MSAARGRLIKAAPWLALAFGRLREKPEPGLSRPGTDGTFFCYDPDWLRRHSSAGSAVLAHCTLHCLLGHVGGKAEDGMAADMAVALLMDEWLPDFCPVHGNELFMQARHRLRGAALNGIAGVMAQDPFFAEHKEVLTGLLNVDDHRLWRPEPAYFRQSGGAGEGWTALRRSLLGGMSRRRIGLSPGTVAARYQPGKLPDRSYRDVLARYAQTREELREDPDAFDPNLYAYGLERYGNMPLIEPCEVREARRVDELAIVIDTSGSCFGDLTARFLDETRALLADETLFTRRFNLRVLQCNARVQRDDAITCLRDFEKYIENLEIVGGGGTDFRPAFERIDRLIARGAFRRLGAALFFTDGMGLFPSAPPEYDAIFVFFEGRYDGIDVPGWAKKLVLKENADEHT